MRRAGLGMLWSCALLASWTGCLAPPASADLALTCSAPCAFTLASLPRDLWEPHVAADPQDPAHLVAAVTVFGGETEAEPFANDMLVAVTRDAGETWSTTFLAHGRHAPADHPLARSMALADPNVAFLPDGTVLVSGLAYEFAATPASGSAQGFRIFVARSTDGGDHFSDVHLVVADEGLATISPLGHHAVGLHAPDAPTMAVAPDGTVHLSWRTMDQPTPAQKERSVMMTARSSDGGRTWSTPQMIDTGGQNAVASQLIATHDGLLFAAVGGWNEGGVTEATEGVQSIARSADGGSTWTVTTLAEEYNSGVAWWPAIADADDGIHFAYAVADAAGHEVVAIRTSRDRGLTFEPPVIVSTALASGHAIPTMSGDGTVAILTFFQPQVDGGERNRLYAMALGSGERSSPVLLDDTLTVDATRLGEYFGIAMAGGRAMPVWTNNAAGGRLMGAWVEPQRA